MGATRFKFGKGRSSGLGKPISGGPHYIVRVFYGGPMCEESLEGPFATKAEAAELVSDVLQLASSERSARL